MSHALSVALPGLLTSVAYVLLRWRVGVHASKARARQKATVKAKPFPPTLREVATAEYVNGRINVIAFLMRVEALYAARVVELQAKHGCDWETVDWTTDPLEPQHGVWTFRDDRLVNAAVESAQAKVEAMKQAKKIDVHKRARAKKLSDEKLYATKKQMHIDAAREAVLDAQQLLAEASRLLDTGKAYSVRLSEFATQKQLREASESLRKYSRAIDRFSDEDY